MVYSRVLALTATIEIKELPASELVMREIYDERGQITGYLSEEEYQRQLKEMEGRVFFGFLVTVGGKAIQIRSEISSPVLETQRKERAHMVSNGFARIGASIYQNFSE